MIGRSRWRATLIRGGANPHCCTQLVSMPVSAWPCRTLRMKSPLGIRPRTAANSRRASSIGGASVHRSLLLQELCHIFFDFRIVGHRILLPLPLAVKDKDTRRAVEFQLLLPDFRLLVKD